MTAPLVFIDTETTSLRPDRLVWEVAMIRRDFDPIGQSETHLFVDSLDLSNADAMSLRIGGYYDRHPDLGWPRPDGAGDDMEAEIARIVEKVTRGAHLVAANPYFDAECLANMLRRHGYLPAWHYHLVNVSDMALGWLNAKAEVDGAARPVPPYKSDALAVACGVEPPTEEERHTAMGDARWVMRWYDAMTGAAS